MTSKTKTAALVVAFCAAVVASSTTIATKIAVREIPPVTLGALRFTLGAVCMLVYMLLSGASLRTLRIKPTDLPRLAATGFLSLVVQAVAIASALTYTSAARVAVLFATSSLWTIVISALRKGERTPLTQLLGVVSTIAGIAVITAPGHKAGDGGRELIGSLLVVVAAVGMASGSILQQRLMARYSLFVVTFYRIALAAAVLLVAALIIEPHQLIAFTGASRDALLALVYLGIMGGAVMYMLWGFALGRLSATQCLVFMNLQPLLVTGFVVAFMGEVLTTTFIVGGIAVIGGIVLSQLPARKPVPVPPPVKKDG